MANIILHDHFRRYFRCLFSKFTQSFWKHLAFTKLYRNETENSKAELQTLLFLLGLSCISDPPPHPPIPFSHFCSESSWDPQSNHIQLICCGKLATTTWHSFCAYCRCGKLKARGSCIWSKYLVNCAALVVRHLKWMNVLWRVKRLNGWLLFLALMLTILLGPQVMTARGNTTWTCVRP